MDLNLTDKHVLITGGSKGIGLACAKAFLQESCRVTLVSRDIATLEQAQRSLYQDLPACQGRVQIVSADLREARAAEIALATAQDEFGSVDILVNSAGAAKRTAPADLTPQHWRDALDAKFFTYINMIEPVIKEMNQRQQGVIVNVIGAGGKTASPLHLAGGSANAALMLATAGYAAAYGAAGIRVVGVNPGPTHTARLNDNLKVASQLENISMEQAMQQATAKIPMGRLAAPEEVADAVVFLASSRASYISGVNINMDGVAVPSVV